MHQAASALQIPPLGQSSSRDTAVSNCLVQGVELEGLERRAPKRATTLLLSVRSGKALGMPSRTRPECPLEAGHLGGVQCKMTSSSMSALLLFSSLLRGWLHDCPAGP